MEMNWGSCGPLGQRPLPFDSSFDVYPVAMDELANPLSRHPQVSRDGVERLTGLMALVGHLTPLDSGNPPLVTWCPRVRG